MKTDGFNMVFQTFWCMHWLQDLSCREGQMRGVCLGQLNYMLFEISSG